MVDPQEKARMERLERRIAALKKATEPEPKTQSNGVGGAELAWRMVIELVAGIVIGFGIGYGLDYLFGTLPILLVLFTMLGFAAGVQTMMRTAAAAQKADDGRGVAPQKDGE
jgi:ATP synthase protein I